MSNKFVVVAGSPIEHSLSPIIHQTGYKAVNLDWQYLKVELNETQLADYVKNRNESLVGMSLTMPLKEVALSVADEITELAQKVNSVNTLIFKNKKVYAGNTDVYGIIQALKTNKKLDVSSPSIIGSGATARSALVALHQLGAKKVRVCARNKVSIQDLSELANNLEMKYEEVEWEKISQALAGTTVISTLPSLGMDKYAAMGPEIPGSLLDVAYSPWPSKIAMEWIFRRGFVVSGLEMLLHQAVMQFELMTGKKAPISKMREALFKN
jgi:shikimate dehydrogenase